MLTLTFLFVTGLAAQYIRRQQVPPVTVDSLVARPTADTAAPATGTPAAPSEASAPSPTNPVNVNAAERSVLKALPGIGQALSERIVQYRSTQRPFQRVEELRRVSGIGPKTLADLRPLVRVPPPDSVSGP